MRALLCVSGGFSLGKSCLLLFFVEPIHKYVYHVRVCDKHSDKPARVRTAQSWIYMFS